MRKQSQGIDYFPFEVDFFSDKKSKVLKARYGADGITVYLYLLCQIYREGYYTRVDKDFKFMVSDDLNMSPDKVEQIMTFLLERSMFDEQLFKSDAVLTSTGIQERWQKAVKTRASKTPIEVTEYWLLNEEQTAAFIKHTLFNNTSEKKALSSEKKDFNSENYSQSKVKESKVNNITHNSAGARESEFESKFNAFVDEFNILVDISDQRLIELDYDKLTEIYRQSGKMLSSAKYGKWLKTLSWIVKNYSKILNENYKDEPTENQAERSGFDIWDVIYGEKIFNGKQSEKKAEKKDSAFDILEKMWHEAEE